MADAHNPDHRNRRSIRLKGYDYAQPGAYFVTVCTQDRGCLLAEVVDGIVIQNDAGKMVQTVWNEMPQHYGTVVLDEFVVMPNHVHGIIMLPHASSNVGATPRGCPAPGQTQGPAPTLSLPDVIHRFKSLTTARYRHGVVQCGWPRFDKRLWQRNYYEHVVRNEDDLHHIREYIADNPAHWAEDENSPANFQKK